MKSDACYLRYSSHAQDESTSIDVQREACQRAAGGVCVEYIDRAKTGRAIGGRAQLQALLADAEAGRLRRVIVWKFSRIGRNLAESASVIQQLEDSGVEVTSATEGSDPFARSIFLAMAEHYSRELASNTRGGLCKRFEQGGFTGGVAPYGFHVTTRDKRRVLEVDETEAAIVRECAHWYTTEASGLKIIARRLRERGISSRRGGEWCFTSVRSLLVNPILTGRLRFNVRRMQLNRKSGNRVPRMREATEHLERQDEALRILDDATFATIAERMTKSRRGGTGAKRAPRGVAPFTGLVFCRCGAKCHRLKSANAKGEYRYYLCSRKMRYDDCQHGYRVREDALMAVVKDRFARLFKHEDRIIARALELAAAAVKSNRGEADRIKSELAAVEGRQSRLVELMMDRQIPASAKATFGREMAEAEDRRAMLLAALDGLREQANAHTAGLAAAVREAFEVARESLAAAATPEQFNRLVDDFIGPLEIQADGGLVPQKQTPPASAEGNLLEYVAGGGFEPPTSGL